ncbi:RacP protein [Streptomyces sp. ISL-98]|uniref:RacP protein n=1 Tax=Streptomyces sp. ISL-98 TaxID=2819192 RepID=UPI001BEBF39F|nr:RacP protein [Streptomyces sp. ISL-98]MBT2509178.1 RacP protein [Streptomyces sp. ISL-98]
MAKRSPAAERHADLIRTALFEVAPAGMVLGQLMGACELSRWQTRRGLATLRDLCAERGWPPVIWGRDLGYHFCASEAELEEWERAWLSEKLTQFRRMITGTIGPHLVLFPKSTWAGYLSDQMKAIESNLAMAARPPR